MTPALPELPVTQSLPALTAALAAEGARAVLCAPPGSGKTTIVPLRLLEAPWLAQQRIVMLEPRRIAARAAATRMSALSGQPVGGLIGYQIRFERRVSDATRIEVVTEGLLTRRLQQDPDLPGVGLVIFDEFHERSLHADLALALCLDACATVRPDLRILVMSATLESERVAQLLGGATQVEARGRLYPVDVHYRPIAANVPLGEASAAAVRRVLPECEGDVLVFLPGAREIRDAQRRLEHAAPELLVRPLYGDLPIEQQVQALQPAPDGRRKAILATNIAQTSLTVEGVRVIVDAGYVRRARFDLGAGVDRLETVRVSRASAEQRAGRAGRLAPGVCYRLWSRDQQSALEAHDLPEIRIADLARLALELARWGITDPASLAWLDPPPASAWSAARELLHALAALDGGERITDHGRALARLPLSPRRGEMLIRAKPEGLAPTAARVAAHLDMTAPAGTADLARRLAGGTRAPEIDRVVRELLRSVQAEDGAAQWDHVGRIVAWGYPERVARRRGERPGVFLCVDGSEARLPEAEPLAHRQWIAIADWDADSPHRIYAAADIDANVVMRDYASAVVEEEVVGWDARAGGVNALRRRRLGALVIEERALKLEADGRGTTLLLEGLRGRGLAVLPWTDVLRQWQARVESLRRWHTEEAWPEVSDEALLRGLEDWLGPYLTGMSRLSDLAEVPLAAALQTLLPASLRSALEERAPRDWVLPNRSRAALDYQLDGSPPVLAARLQMFFGTTRTPAIDHGRMPLLLHLLSPAGRPMQVTRDLDGFWDRTYPEVRRELRARYPRHPWPDDPRAAAPPQRRGSRR